MCGIKQNQIDAGDTKIHASRCIRIVMLQKDRQRCHKDQDDACLYACQQIHPGAPLDKVCLDIRKQHDQHIDEQYDTNTLKQLGFHIFNGNITEIYQPKISTAEITA